MRISDWSSDVCSSDLLGLPGKALSHHLERQQLGMVLEEVLLAGFPCPFDELDDADLHAPSEGADRHATSDGRLALAIAGVDDKKAALLGLACLALVPRALKPVLPLLVQVVYFLF